MSQRLQGKTAWVTGGGTGIGAATARRLRAAGANVLVTGRRAAPIEAVARDIGGLALAGDVADPAHCEAVVAHARTHFGGLDILVANAGIETMGAVTELDPEQWREVFRVNVDGVLHAARAALPALRARGAGAIVIVASVAALRSGPHYAAYVASKTALLGLARSMAYDYGADGIRINTVCPGWVRTEMSDREFAAAATARGISVEAMTAQLTRYYPLRRMARPEEIAACIEFLASDDASFVTGAVLTADGGGEVVDVGTLAFME